MAFIAIVSFGTASFSAPASSWPSLVGLLAVVAGCTPIGPEFSSGTLQLILVKPVKRSAYLLSRVAGVILVTWVAALIGFTSELLGRAIMSQPIAIETQQTALLNTSIEAVLTVSLLVLLGSLTRAYFNVAIYITLQIALGMTIAFAAAGRRWPAVSRALEQVMNNLYPEAPRSLDSKWLLLVLSNAAIALLLACLIFRRREVPYGAD
jgi:ABC-type transport system involved in multi-copper enzyme maturation permease subunit